MEYTDILRELYSDDFVDMILQGDLMAHMMTGEYPTIETTGNIFVKFSQGNGCVCVMGMVSKTGKISKSDYKDILIWGKRLKDALLDGNIVLTSTNKFTKPILLKLIKDLDVDITVLHTMNFPFGVWESIQIELV